jgi:hypothetical protein
MLLSYDRYGVISIWAVNLWKERVTVHVKGAYFQKTEIHESLSIFLSMHILSGSPKCATALTKTAPRRKQKSPQSSPEHDYVGCLNLAIFALCQNANQPLYSLPFAQ